MKGARAWTAVLAAVSIAFLTPALRGQEGVPAVRIAGVEVPPGNVLAFVVDGDLGQPDAAWITLRAGSALSAGLDVEVTAGGEPIFRGEIVSIEPSFPKSGEPAVNVRALDRLHRLTNGTRTRTFVGQSDADIVRQLAVEAGLEAEVGGPEASITHDQVNQHNQTDLAFLQERAALIGYQVFTERETLHFARRRAEPPEQLGCQPDDARLDALAAWLPPAGVVKEVTVRGWDPAKQEEIVGRARQEVIGLSPGASQIDQRPSTISLGFNETLQSAAAAHATVAGALGGMTERDLSAELAVDGHASLRVGSRVLLRGTGAAFDGEYVVTRASHRFDGPAGAQGHTLLQVARADRAVFLLPEVGDEVLVGFQGGDPDRPIIVGSLWNPSGSPADLSPCRRGR
jgi:phage protein D